MEDYLEIYDLNQLKDIISEEQFKELGIEEGDDRQFIKMNCINCGNPVGVKDAFNKYYIFFDAI